MTDANNYTPVLCASCGGAESILVETYNGYKIYRCSSCGLEFCNPMKSMSAAEYSADAAYNHFRALGENSQRSVLWWGHKQFVKTAIKKLSLKSHAKILDIGCGTGAFVDFALKHGYDSYGVDFDGNSVRIAHKSSELRDRVFLANATSIRDLFSGSKFDVVTFFEVLEHVEDLHAFLSLVSDLLASEGVIALYVPLADRWSLRFNPREPADYPPNHLTRWTVKALTVLMRNSGFKVVRVQESPVSFGVYRAVSAISSDVEGKALETVNPPVASRAINRLFNFAVDVKQVLLTPLLSFVGVRGDRVLLIAKKQLPR